LLKKPETVEENPLNPALPPLEPEDPFGTESVFFGELTAESPPGSSDKDDVQRRSQSLPAAPLLPERDKL
jgi:hypothetical protein